MGHKDKNRDDSDDSIDVFMIMMCVFLLIVVLGIMIEGIIELHSDD